MNRKLLSSAVLLALLGGAIAIRADIIQTVRTAVWPDEESPLKWAPRPTETAITVNDLRTRLYQIADDSMMGRRVGEEGNFKTTSYIAREFQRLGLKPGGDNGTYFQVLPWGSMAYDSMSSRLVIGSTPVAARVDWVPMTPSTATGVVGTIDVQNAATVFAGQWGDTMTSLPPALVQGKIAVFSAPTVGAPPANGRGGAPGAAGNFVTVRDRRALSAGAAGVLVVTADSLPRGALAAPFTGRSGMQPAAPATPAAGSAAGIPAASISNAAVARIFNTPLSQLTVGTAGQPVTARWNYGFNPTRFPARNVIAILPGSDPARAGEYVLVGAHNDHVGTNGNQGRGGFDHDSLRAYNKVIRPQGANDPARTPTAAEQRRIDSLIAYARKIRPVRRDTIMNGADDDGSGTVLMVELAERFAKEKPARSIVFMSHQGEEAGLLGSAWFVNHPTIPLDKIAAAINMDMVGKGRVNDVRFGGPNSVQSLGSRRLSRQFGDIIDSVNAISKAPMAIDKSWDVPANPLNRFCRSDQVNYVNSNVPVVYFSLGYSPDYHQASDEPQYIDYVHTARLGGFVYDIMTAIANRVDRPLIVGQDTTYPSCRR